MVSKSCKFHRIRLLYCSQLYLLTDVNPAYRTRLDFSSLFAFMWIRLERSELLCEYLEWKHSRRFLHRVGIRYCKLLVINAFMISAGIRYSLPTIIAGSSPLWIILRTWTRLVFRSSATSLTVRISFMTKYCLLSSIVMSLVIKGIVQLENIIFHDSVTINLVSSHFNFCFSISKWWQCYGISCINILSLWHA